MSAIKEVIAFGGILRKVTLGCALSAFRVNFQIFSVLQECDLDIFQSEADGDFLGVHFWLASRKGFVPSFVKYSIKAILPI